MGKDGKKGGGGAKFLWNGETKEFLGRDGGSWAKITLFYAIFYAFLASFFVGMLAVFFQLMPKDVPMYYNESGTMNARDVNPGLGFRPQIDVEDLVIKYNPTIFDDLSSGDSYGYKKYTTNLKNFLNSKYADVNEGAQEIDCADGSDHSDELKSGKVCKFDYKKTFATTPCTEENDFGFKTPKACILIKLNKIVGWLPKFKEGEKQYISVKCEGEVLNIKY
jgi:sodium/potassium-transporting ATPase subunit beta